MSVEPSLVEFGLFGGARASPEGRAVAGALCHGTLPQRFRVPQSGARTLLLSALQKLGAATLTNMPWRGGAQRDLPRGEETLGVWDATVRGEAEPGATYVCSLWPEAEAEPRVGGARL